MTRRLLAALSVSALLLPGPAAFAGDGRQSDLELRFIGEATFPTGFMFDDTEVGGLSGIDYNRGHRVYYALSDDRSNINPARFYTLTIDLSDGALEDGDVQFLRVTTLLDENGQPFAENSVDPEAIRLDPRTRTLYWTSEGDANAFVPPFVREMTLTGAYLRELETPDKFFPTVDWGIRNNLAFESLTFSRRLNRLVTATENALLQDGPAASLTEGSPSRFVVFNARNGRAIQEFVYVTDPVAAEPNPIGSFTTNGLVELLAVGPEHYLAVERSFSVGVGNAIKIYLADVRGARNVKNLDSILGQDVRIVRKRLLLDLDVLGITLDNIEGITFGPRLPSGELSLILVSDNNFNPNGQFTQFLAFAIEED
jgi:3-phytase/alkaline phosphatase D